MPRRRVQRHRADEDLRCIDCGELGPWQGDEECSARPEWWQVQHRLRAEASARYQDALAAHRALGGTPLTLSERLALRVSMGP